MNKEKNLKGSEDQEQKKMKQRYFFIEVLCNPLVLLKSALFFWFMGAYEGMAFSSVFFKQRGLTIEHISLITSTSMVIQFFVTFLTGVISDKVGTAKPILLTHITISILVSLGFVLAPSIQNCNETEFFLHCNGTVAAVKKRHPELCNSTENCSSFHISSGSSNCSESCAVKLVVSPGEFPAEDTSINSTHKIRFVERRRVIECELNDSCIHESNCFQTEDQCSEVNSSNTLLLVLYGLLICLFYTSRSSTHRLYDFIGVSLSAKHGVDFGRQQMWGILGNAIGSPMVGYTIRAFHTDDGREDYSLAFSAYMLLAFLSGLSICRVDCRVKPRSENVWKAFFALLKKPDMIVYLTLLFVIGTSNSFNAIYLGLFQEELGASAFVIGLTSMITSACGLPFLLTAEWWIRMLGNRAIFLLALFLSAFFHVSVSFVETSLPVMFLVLVNIFTFHLLWVEAMNFARTIAPEEVAGTVIVTAGCLYYVITKASASLIGGMVMSAYGSRMANRVIGAMCLLTGVLYLLFICCSSKREKPQEQSKL